MNEIDKKSKILIPSSSERYAGCLLGAAAGDALGMPTEFISRRELEQFYNGRVVLFKAPLASHACAHLKAGQYTDDTQQLLILAESLIACNRFNIDDFGRRIGEWGHRCLTETGYDRWGGTTSLSAANQLHAGKNPRITGGYSPSCGSAMRVAPIGLFYESQEKRDSAATEASLITHTHPAAIEGAKFTANVVAYLLQGSKPEEAVALARNQLKSDLQEKINKAISLKDEKPEIALRSLGASSSIYETLPAAVYCFLSKESFTDVIVEAANLVPGDTDSIACIAGAWAGTHFGKNAIPYYFREGLENRAYIERLAEQLKEKSLNSRGERRI
jgi:ADP-ribosylglycohydrolase